MKIFFLFKDRFISYQLRIYLDVSFKSLTKFCNCFFSPYSLFLWPYGLGCEMTEADSQIIETNKNFQFFKQNIFSLKCLYYLWYAMAVAPFQKHWSQEDTFLGILLFSILDFTFISSRLRLFQNVVFVCYWKFKERGNLQTAMFGEKDGCCIIKALWLSKIYWVRNAVSIHASSYCNIHAVSPHSSNHFLWVEDGSGAKLLDGIPYWLYTLPSM